MTKASYYITPYLEELRKLPADAPEEERRHLELLISVNIGDSDVLADVLGRTPEPFDDFYGERSGYTPDTEDTIQTFLSNFGAPGSATAPIPEEIPVVPAYDYASAFLAETPPSPPRPAAEAAEEKRPAKPEKSPEPAPLTESLVKILVKKGKYEDALQIISELNLKNPEKSIYFADQMRFIRKVLICKSKSNT